MSDTEWFDKKRAVAKFLVDKYEQERKPLCVVVTENTANLFSCVLRDCIDAAIIERRLPLEIYLAHSYESFAQTFRDMGRLYYEDEILDSLSHHDAARQELDLFSLNPHWLTVQGDIFLTPLSHP